MTPLPEPRHRLVERIVAAVQRVLLPGATVEHDVLLPDLHLPGEPIETCQCDVVVRTSNTITIIEVQDREAVVDVNTYRGWCLKREHVGAHNLICVSAAGFPRSIRRDSILRGPAVRLVTLDELEAGSSVALLGALPAVFSIARMSAAIQQVRLVSLDRDPCKVRPLPNFDANAVAFANADGRRSSLRQILKPMAHQPELLFGPTAEYQHEFETTSGVGLRYLPDGEDGAPVDVAGIIVLRVEHRKVPVTISAYCRIEEEQPAAWTMRAADVFDGSGQIRVRVVFAPNEDGLLHSRIELDGIGEDADVVLKLGPARLDVYSGPEGRRVTTSGPRE